MAWLEIRPLDEHASCGITSEELHERVIQRQGPLMAGCRQVCSVNVCPRVPLSSELRRGLCVNQPEINHVVRNARPIVVARPFPVD
jgi:hypothetical protein